MIRVQDVEKAEAEYLALRQSMMSTLSQVQTCYPTRASGREAILECMHIDRLLTILSFGVGPRYPKARPSQKDSNSDEGTGTDDGRDSNIH